jgi:hypothetical protein
MDQPATVPFPPPILEALFFAKSARADGLPIGLTALRAMARKAGLHR